MKRKNKIFTGLYLFKILKATILKRTYNAIKANLRNCNYTNTFYVIESFSEV